MQTYREFSVNGSYFSPNTLPEYPEEKQIPWASPAALLACFARYRPPKSTGARRRVRWQISLLIWRYWCSCSVLRMQGLCHVERHRDSTIQQHSTSTSCSATQQRPVVEVQQSIMYVQYSRTSKIWCLWTPYTLTMCQICMYLLYDYCGMYII